MTSPRLTPERRRALELLASSRQTASKGCSCSAMASAGRLLAGLGRCGLAAAEGGCGRLTGALRCGRGAGPTQQIKIGEAADLDSLAI